MKHIISTALLLYISVNSICAQQTKEELRSKAKSFTHQGNLDAAVQVLDAALLTYPNDPDLLKDEIYVAYLNRDYAKALDLSKTALQLKDADEETYQMAGLNYKAIADYKATMKKYGFSFDWSRVSPMGGFSRLFSIRSATELVKSWIKILAIGSVGYLTIKQDMLQFSTLTQFGMETLLPTVGWATFTAALMMSGAALVIGALDYGYQRFEWERGLRMSRDEIREESRAAEGDPGLKAKIRSTQREMSRKRMMAAVPKADVIITNPTHLAVALKYDSKAMGAPIVVAKGAGFVAEKIREIGRQHGVMIVENKLVARTLYKLVEVGRELEVGWLEVLVGVNAVVSIALISMPSVPHFGGVKHWFPSMPFLAVLAAGTLQRASEAVSARFKALTADAAAALLSVAVLLPATIATARIYEFGTSAYGDFAGGLPGAASLGMQRQYWSNNVTGVLDWLNTNLRPGERVYLHEVHGGQIRDLQRNGMLRADIGFTGGPNDADVVVYQYHQEFREHEFNAWEALGTTKPVAGLYVDETPQLVIYRRGVR